LKSESPPCKFKPLTQLSGIYPVRFAVHSIGSTPVLKNWQMTTTLVTNCNLIDSVSHPQKAIIKETTVLITKLIIMIMYLTALFSRSVVRSSVTYVLHILPLANVPALSLSSIDQV
jgi:hypothetical protein